MMLSDIHTQLGNSLADAGIITSRLRTALSDANQQLIEIFKRDVPVRTLVNGRAQFVDDVLIHLWNLLVGDDQKACLVAVGGYGRGELHPASDIDLLLLVENPDDSSLSESLSNFITLLWDIGLQVGQSVRTPRECADEGANDVTITTNLIESRHLAGQRRLFDAMLAMTGPDKIWPTGEFFAAKLQEQRTRHTKYDDTAHNLEPNIKSGPGGLRDIQMIGWVAKRHFGAQSMHALVEHKFLTETEFDALKRAEAYLWKVRFALHAQTGREEDRLLFDYQRTLASEFGHDDDDANLGVEKFMQKYYRTVTRVERLNEMLLQHFEESILIKNQLRKPCILNHRFQTINDYLEVTDNQLFSHRPVAMLELFLLIAQNPNIKGVRASTIRLFYQHLHLIDDKFRRNKKAQLLFLELLKQSYGVTRVLRQMNRSGFLSAYIPDFANIVGRMQYDLFHVYTVDTHTLFLVRNLRRFAVEQFAHEFPLCSQVMQQIPKQELLMLAALFHDIAKGRGGDHSVLGEAVALKFCHLQGLSAHDSQLVGWLVRSHLIMSMTAQRKDIEDPAVINTFAQLVGSKTRLDHLFLLTNADMRATNPKRWNSWKGTLLEQLYKATRHALENKTLEDTYVTTQIQEKQQEALKILEHEFEQEKIIQFWATLSTDYFQHTSSEEIAWHTEVVCQHLNHYPHVSIRQRATHGGSEILLIDRDRENLFAISTWVLDQLSLNIMHAHLETSDTGITINSFIVLESDGKAIQSGMRAEEIKTRLSSELSNPEPISRKLTPQIPRQMRYFDIENKISFQQDNANQRTIMRVQTVDCNGLLAVIGQVFTRHGISIHHAKIATIGAQVDDTFFISDLQGSPVSDEKIQSSIKQELLEKMQC